MAGTTGGVDARPVRLLAVSDEIEPRFDYERNRADLSRSTAIIGAGDLEPDYLDFLADAFQAPLLYVRGNHDRGGGWHEGSHHVAGAASMARGTSSRGLTVAGLVVAK